jgi:hypothetical protein
MDGCRSEMEIMPRKAVGELDCMAAQMLSSYDGSL